MSTILKSGVDSTLASVDPTTKALLVKPTGIGTITFNQNDFITDSFGRLRVSDARVAFEQTFGSVLTSTLSTIWESTPYGAGTQNLTTNLYGLELNTTTGTTTGYWIQTYNHIRYAPGISTVFRMTFNFNTLTTNLRQRLGMFTDQGTFPSTQGDGFFLEADGSAISVVRRYMTTGGGGAEERILQNSWNMDKLDGTGASGVNLNWLLTQHLIVEYQWLGVGVIRFGFETGLSGIVWCHQIISVNTLSTTWSRTGSLPVRVEISSAGALPVPGKLTIINCVVIQEGDIALNRGWRYFGSNTGPTAKTGGTAIGLYPLMSLRAISTNDLTKRAKIVPTSLTVNVITPGTVGNTPIQVALLALPTPNTAATFAQGVTGSSVTVDIAATATAAVTGAVIWSGIVPNVSGSTVTFDLNTMSDNLNIIGYNAAGTVAIAGSSVLTLAAGPLNAAFTAAAVISASLNWKELV